MENKHLENQPTPEDAQNMDALVARAKAILQDESAMATLGEKARKILEQLVMDVENNLTEVADGIPELLTDEDYIAELEKFLAKIEERDDQNSSFLINIDKGSPEEIFYKVFIEEVPDSGVSINPQAEARDGTPQPHLAAIETVPYKTDREFIVNLCADPMVQILEKPSMPRVLRLQKELEQQGLFPTDLYKRSLRREYEHNMQIGDKDRWQKAIESEGLSNIEPISDQEVADMMRKVIREAYKKKLGL